MEDGIWDAEVDGVYYVHSFSDNYRVVDMYSCTCSCPGNSQTRICSHLCAVGAKNKLFSFRLSLFTFSRWAMSQKAYNHSVADMMNQYLLNEVIYKSNMPQNTLVSYLLQCFTGLIIRGLQEKKGKLPMVSVDSVRYNNPSDEEHSSQSFISRLVRFSKCIHNNKDYVVQPEGLLRWHFFFKKMGPEFGQTLKLFDYMLTIDKPVKKYGQMRSDITQNKETKISTLHLSSSSSEDELQESSLIVSQAKHLKDLIYWLIEQQTNSTTTNEDITNTEKKIVPVMDGTYEIGTLSIQVLSEIEKLRHSHQSFIQLLIMISKNLKPQFNFGNGLIELLENELLIFPSLLSASSLSMSLPHFFSTLMKAAQVFVLNDVHVPTEYHMSQYLSLPGGFQSLGVSMSDIQLQSRGSPSSEIADVIIQKKKVQIQKLYFLFDDQTNETKHIKKGIIQLKRDALNSIITAPYCADLSRYLHWDKYYRDVLGSFEEFILHLEILNHTEFCILEIGFLIFIKVPTSLSFPNHFILTSDSLSILLGECIYGFVTGTLTKKKCEEYFCSSSFLNIFLNCTNIYALFLSLYRHAPLCIFSVIDWILTFFKTDDFNDIKHLSDEVLIPSIIQSPLNEQFGTPCSDSLFEEQPSSNEWCILPSNQQEELNLHKNEDTLSQEEELNLHKNEDTLSQEEELNLHKNEDILSQEDDYVNIIKKIREEEFGIYENISQNERVIRGQRERLSRAVKRLAEDLYADPSHLLLELLQNADDNSYPLEYIMSPTIQTPRNQIPSLHIIRVNEGIGLVNNEIGFSKDDVYSLCDIGNSSKKKGRIGKFGIGFKSVFKLTHTPHIFSNKLHFKFKSNDSSGVSYLLPYVLEHNHWSMYCPSPVSQSIQTCPIVPTTVMWLPVSNDLSSLPFFKTILDSAEPYWLLFLNKIRCLSLNDIPSGRTILFRRCIGFTGFETNLTEYTSEQIHFIQFLHNYPNYQHIIIYSEITQMNDHQDPVIQMEHSKTEYHFLLYEEKSHDMTTSSCIIAIPLHTTKFVPKISNVPLPVFAYLPIRSVGLRFAIHADFSVAATREDILSRDPTNQKIIHQIGVTIQSIILTISSNLLAPEIFGFIPLVSEPLGEFSVLGTSIISSLSSCPLIPVIGTNNRVTLDQAVLPKHIDVLLNTEDIMINENERSNRDFWNLITDTVTTVSTILNKESDNIQYRQLVQLSFISRVGIDVCTQRLKIQQFGTWDIIDRFVAMSQQFSNQTSITAIDQWAPLLGCLLVLLDICLEETMTTTITTIMQCVLPLTIIPITSPQYIMDSIKNGTQIIACDSSNNYFDLILKTKRFHILHSSVLNWITILNYSHPTDHMSTSSSIRLKRTLRNLGIIFTSDDNFISDVILPLLTNDSTLETRLTFSDCINLTTYCLCTCPQSLDSTIIYAAPNTQQDQISCIPLKPNSFLSRKSGLFVQHLMEHLQELSKPPRFHISCEQYNPTLRVKLYGLHTVLQRRFTPSFQYWDQQIQEQLDWDIFFKKAGSTTFLSLEPLTYRVAYTSIGHKSVKITLMSYPDYWDNKTQEYVQEFLSSDYIQLHCLHQISLVDNSSLNELDIDDFINVDLLLLSYVFDSLVSPHIFAEKYHDLLAILGDIFKELLPSLCLLDSTKAISKLYTDQTFPSILPVQLSHMNWFPVTQYTYTKGVNFKTTRFGSPITSYVPLCDHQLSRLKYILEGSFVTDDWYEIMFNNIQDLKPSNSDPHHVLQLILSQLKISRSIDISKLCNLIHTRSESIYPYTMYSQTHKNYEQQTLEYWSILSEVYLYFDSALGQNDQEIMSETLREKLSTIKWCLAPIIINKRFVRWTIVSTSHLYLESVDYLTYHSTFFSVTDIIKELSLQIQRDQQAYIDEINSVKQFFSVILQCPKLPTINHIINELHRVIHNDIYLSNDNNTYYPDDLSPSHVIELLYTLATSDRLSLSKENNAEEFIYWLQTGYWESYVFGLNTQSPSTLLNVVPIITDSHIQWCTVKTCLNPPDNCPLFGCYTEFDISLWKSWKNISRISCVWNDHCTDRKHMSDAARAWWNKCTLILAQGKTLDSVSKMEIIGKIEKFQDTTFHSALTNGFFASALPLAIRYFASFDWNTIVQLLLFSPEDMIERVKSIELGVSKDLSKRWQISSDYFKMTDNIAQDHPLSDTMKCDIVFTCNPPYAANPILVFSPHAIENMSSLTQTIFEQILIEFFPASKRYPEFLTLFSVVLALQTSSRCSPTKGFCFDDRLETLLTKIKNIPTLNKIPQAANDEQKIITWFKSIISLLGAEEQLEYGGFVLELFLSNNKKITTHSTTSVELTPSHNQVSMNENQDIEIIENEGETIYDTEEKLHSPSDIEILSPDSISDANNKTNCTKRRTVNSSTPENKTLVELSVPDTTYTHCGSFVGEVVPVYAQRMENASVVNSLTPEIIISVGRQGEDFVYRYLLDCYSFEIYNERRKVNWVNKERESGLPYDICIETKSSEGDISELQYIEVKATRTKTKSFFEISNKEWHFAQMQGDKYYIFRLFGVGTNAPSLIRIKNPYRQWRTNKAGMFFAF